MMRDAAVARIYLATGIWSERVGDVAGGEDPWPSPLRDIIVAAALAHAGVLLGMTDICAMFRNDLAHPRQVAGATRSDLLHACRVVVARRDPLRDPWDLRELAESEAARALAAAVDVLWPET